MADKQSDYLAVISISGVGSWARFPDKQQAIDYVIRRFKSDYRKVFKIGKGTVVCVSVVDVSGYDSVWWDANYFYHGENRLDRPVESIQHTY